MTDVTWTFIPPSQEWTPETLPPNGDLVWVVDENADDRSTASLGAYGRWWMSWSGSDDVHVTAWAPITYPAAPQHPVCGAVFTGREGQEPCRKWRDHHLGPDTDWKRDMHSNGLLKWPVDNGTETAS